MTHSTRASLAAVPLTWRHLVLSLFGLIARPVVDGGAVDEADEEDEVLDAEEEVDEEAEEEVGGFPELSCLIKSAARSACSSVLMIDLYLRRIKRTRP